MSDDARESSGLMRGLMRWFKRIGLGAAVIALLVGAYFFLSRNVTNELQVELDAIAARGEPITMADLTGPPIPDEDNAALLYQQALETDLIATERRLIDSLRELSNCEVENRATRQENREDIAAVLTAGAEALALARQARSRPACDWQVKLTIPFPLNFDFSPLTGSKRLAQLLILAAVDAHDRGDDAAACEYLRDCLHLGEVYQLEPLLIHNLVGISVGALAVDPLYKISSELDLSDPAARAAAEALLSDLLDETAPRQGLTSAMLGERCYGHATMESLKKSKGGFGASGWRQAATPKVMMNRQHVSYLQSMAAYVRASREDTLPAAKRLMPAEQANGGFLRSILHGMEDLVSCSGSRMIELSYRGLVIRRMAATALAIRLYETDHGRRPATLEELVPDYLPAVPQDPYSDGARPIGYLPDADEPVLYSVYEDSIDDGGQNIKGCRLDVDAVLYLNGQPPEDDDDEGTIDWDDSGTAPADER